MEYTTTVVKLDIEQINIPRKKMAGKGNYSEGNQNIQIEIQALKENATTVEKLSHL